MVNEETARTAEAGNGNIDPITTLPHRPDPPSPLAQQSPDNIGFWAQLRPHLDLVSKLVPIAWSLFLFAGGLIFLIYFWSIGFMPELDVKASVTLLAVSAITGSALFLALALGLVVPGWIWAHMLRTCDPLRQLWSADDGKSVSKRVFQWLGWPICGVMLGILGGLSLVVYGVKFYGLGTWWSFWASFLAGWFISGGIAGYCLRRKLGNHFGWGAIAQFYSSFLINSLVFLMITIGIVIPYVRQSYFVRPDILGSQSETFFLIFLALGTFLPVIIASEIALKLSGIQDDRPQGRFSLPISIIYFSALLSLPIAIANSVMSIYKFGLVNNASLVLDETGCNIVQHYQLEEQAASSGQKGCSLSNVVIHSRLGTAYYLEVRRDGKTPMRFTIPTQHVLSWSTPQAGKPTTAETPQSQKNSASTAGTTQPKDSNSGKEN